MIAIIKNQDDHVGPRLIGCLYVSFNFMETGNEGDRVP